MHAATAASLLQDLLTSTKLYLSAIATYSYSGLLLSEVFTTLARVPVPGYH